MLVVGDHKELQAAVLAMKSADRDLKRRINVATRETMNPVWKTMVTAHLGGTDVMTSRMLDNGVRIAAGNPPRAMAAQSTRAVGRGKRLVPSRDFAGWEFGVNRMAYSRYERKNPFRPVHGGRKRTGNPSGTHVVERRTMMGMPRRQPQGRVVYPAFAEIAPRMVSLWVQIIVKSYNDAAEGK